MASLEGEKKSVNFNGYTAFYQHIAGSIKENCPGSSLSSMSKVAASMWKQCSMEVRKDWNKEGQRIREDIDMGLKEYKCHKCQKKFTRMKDKTYHEKDCGQRACGVCSKHFSCGKQLARHMTCHTQQNACNTCGKGFSTRQALTMHEASHSKVKNYACDVCSSSFAVLSNLKRHKKGHE